VCLKKQEAIMKKIFLMFLLFNVFFSFCYAQKTIICSTTGKQATLPAIISRADWGARGPVTKANITQAQKDKGITPIVKYSDYKDAKGTSLEKPNYTKIVLHNTAMGCGYGKDKGKNPAKAIQDFQMDEDPILFADIAYNFLIDCDGNIYEGRELFYVPAHAGRTKEADEKHDITLSPNYAAIGIAFSGDPNSALKPVQVEAAKKLIGFDVDCYGVNSIITHTEVKQELINKGLTPKGDYDPKVCPGVGTVNEIVSIRIYTRGKYGIPFDEEAYRKLFK